MLSMKNRLKCDETVIDVLIGEYAFVSDCTFTQEIDMKPLYIYIHNNNNPCSFCIVSLESVSAECNITTVLDCLLSLPSLLHRVMLVVAHFEPTDDQLRYHPCQN